MKVMSNQQMVLCLLIPGWLLLGCGQWAWASEDALATTRIEAAQVSLVPKVANDGLTLSVSGPGMYRIHQVYAPGEQPAISLVDADGKALADGLYRYELRARPVLAEDVVERLATARETGDEQVLEKLQNEGVIPRMIPVQAGSFTVRKGAFVTGELSEAITKDYVVNDDLIVTGCLCVGRNCADNEVFDFDTLKIKWDKIRFLFEDTSQAPYASNDWRLVINDIPAGGANYFAVQDVDADQIPFKIEAGAPDGALYVDGRGQIGLGTQTPVAKLHLVSGDSPQVRLEQDDSGGFAARTWRVVGNESNFLIEDTTNNSTIPFRIMPGAPDNSLTLTRDGVGIGTFAPEAQLHVRGSWGDTSILVEEGNEEIVQRTLLKLANNGAVRFDLVDNSTGVTWVFQNQVSNFAITAEGTGSQELELDRDGNLVILGTLTVRDGFADRETYPDYVFDADYELMPLDELRAYIEENRHLPEIPTATTVRSTGLNMTQMQVKLLEKIEELTLYTLAQEETIRTQEAGFQESLTELNQRLLALESEAAR